MCGMCGYSPEKVGRQANVLKGVVGEDVEGQEGQRNEAGHQPSQTDRQI